MREIAEPNIIFSINLLDTKYIASICHFPFLGIIKIISILLLLVVSLTKDYDKSLSIIVSVIASSVAILSEIIDQKEKSNKNKILALLNAADARFTEGRHFFKDGISLSSKELLEQAIVIYHSCLAVYKYNETNDFRLGSTYSGIAFASEKISYIGSSEAIVLSFVEGNLVCTLAIKGDMMGIAGGSKDIIHCTLYKDEERWQDARKFYDEFCDLIISNNSYNESDALALLSAIRNAVYFSICDGLQTGRAKFDKTELLIEMGIKISTEKRSLDRLSDFEMKKLFLSRLRNLPVTSNRLCELVKSKGRMDERSIWRFAEDQPEEY